MTTPFRPPPPQTGTTHYYFYNITNALDLIETAGTTPELREVHVAIDWVSIDFDVTFSKDDSGEEVVSYQTWSSYTPNAEYKDVLKEKITQINPIYFAGIPGLAGTEKTVFMGFSYLVMGNMASLYNETMRAVAVGLCEAYSGVSSRCLGLMRDRLDQAYLFMTRRCQPSLRHDLAT